MAFSSIGNLGGTANANTNQTSIAMTTAMTNAPAGSLVIVVVAADNTVTTDTDGNKVSAVNDSAGNTYTKAIEFTNGQGAAQAGTVCAVYYSVLTSALNTGGTITATLGGTTTHNDAQAMMAWCFGITGNSVEIEATNTLAGDGTGGTSIGSLNATTANIECLRIRATSFEIASGTFNSPNTWPPTTNWTAMDMRHSSSGGGASAQSVGGEFRISTATSDASNPSDMLTANVDLASVYVAFREVGSKIAVFQNHYRQMGWGAH